MYGLLDRDMNYIIKSLDNFPEIERAVIFGSRAMGNFKNGSDVDLAIVGSKITRDIVSGLDDLLNEIYPLPYFFDVLHYEQLSNRNLKEHIDAMGKLIYQREEKHRSAQ